MSTAKTGPVEIYINNGPPLTGSLDVHQDVQWEHSDLPRPDPRWQFTDSNGHYHAHADDKLEPYPTLDRVVEPVACDGSCGGTCDGEGYSTTRYFCLICREEITPGSLSGPYRFAIPGLKSWTVEVPSAITAERVSVRIEAAGTVMFGVAGYGQWTHDSEYGHRTSLTGIGPLGRRKA